MGAGCGKMRSRLQASLERITGEMPLDEICQALKNLIQRGGGLTKERVQDGGGLEEPVEVTAEHIARRVLPSQAGDHLAQALSRCGHGGMLGGLPVVNLIAFDKRAGERAPVPRQLSKAHLGAAHGFVLVEHGDQGQ